MSAASRAEAGSRSASHTRTSRSRSASAIDVPISPVPITTALCSSLTLPPSRDVVPEARRSAARMVVLEARKVTAREASGVPPGQQSLAAGKPRRGAMRLFGPAAAA